MKHSSPLYSLSLLSVWLMWVAPVTNVVAAAPSEKVVLQCADFGSSTVVFYDHSADAPTQTPGTSCAAQVESLLTAGLTNVNATVQTWTTTSGAPGGVPGTYTTYVMTGTLSSGDPTGAAVLTPIMFLLQLSD